MQEDSLNNKDLQAYFEQLKQDLSSYINKRIKLFRLRSYEKISITSSYIVYSLIVIILLFNIFFLFLLVLGFFLGECLNSNAAGFGVLILFTILILIIYMLNAKKIRGYITNKVVTVIKKIESDEQ